MATTWRDRIRDTIGSLGDMPYLGAAGRYVAVGGVKATGKAPIIKSDGTLEWQTPGGGAVKFLGEVLAVAAADAQFTSLVSVTYDDYELVWEGMTPGTSTAVLGIQMSITNGASWITTGYEYGGSNYGTSTNFSNYGRAASQHALSFAPGGMGTANKAAGATRIYGANVSEAKYGISNGLYGGSDGNTYGVSCYARYSTATTFDALRVIASSGTVTGRFRLYGIVKA